MNILLKKLVLVCSVSILSPLPAFAGIYEALCEGDVNCTVTVSPSGITSPVGSIPLTRVTYWGGGGESSSQIGLGAATTILLGPVGLLGFLAKNHDYRFAIRGFDSSGDEVAMQVRFKNKNVAKQFIQELSAVTGLAMNQTRTVDEIKSIERKKQSDSPGKMPNANPFDEDSLDKTPDTNSSDEDSPGKM